MSVYVHFIKARKVALKEHILKFSIKQRSTGITRAIIQMDKSLANGHQLHTCEFFIHWIISL